MTSEAEPNVSVSIELDELFADALAEASVLIELDAAEVEAWVSGLLSTWRCDWPDEDHEQIDRALIKACRTAASVGPLLICAAIAELRPPLRDVAHDAVDDIGRRLPGSDSIPDAVDLIGTSRSEAAWHVSSADSSDAAIVIGFIQADASEHSLLADLDEQGRLCNLVFAGPASLVVPATSESDEKHDWTDENLDGTVEVRQLSAEDAASAIAVAWQAAAENSPAISDEFVLNQLLAAARLGQLVPGVDLPFLTTVEAAGIDEGAPTDASDGDGLTDAERAEANASSLRTLHYALRHHRDDPEPTSPARPLDGLMAEVADSIVQPGDGLLEWADWLGVIIGLVRAGPYSDATPRRFVDHINRCAEVATTIPKHERAMIEDEFETVIDRWTSIGVLDDARLTTIGHWVLPRAAARAWGGTF